MGKISCAYVFVREEHVGPRLVATEAALGLEISHTLATEVCNISPCGYG